MMDKTLCDSSKTLFTWYLCKPSAFLYVHEYSMGDKWLSIKDKKTGENYDYLPSISRALDVDDSWVCVAART